MSRKTVMPARSSATLGEACGSSPQRLTSSRGPVRNPGAQVEIAITLTQSIEDGPGVVPDPRQFGVLVRDLQLRQPVVEVAVQLSRVVPLADRLPDHHLAVPQPRGCGFSERPRAELPEVVQIVAADIAEQLLRKRSRSARGPRNSKSNGPPARMETPVNNSAYLNPSRAAPYPPMLKPSMIRPSLEAHCTDACPRLGSAR